MINFLQVTNANPYKTILDTFINPIIKYLPDYSYKITNAVDKNCLNINFFRENFLPQRDVFICHGIADKNYRDKRWVSGFDYLFVSGTLWRDKYIKQGVSPHKIFITGYTKLDPIFNNELKRNKYDNPVILYAPTHTNSPTLQGKFEPYLNMLSEKYVILNSVHPHNKKDRKPTMQSLVDCDVVISDSGSLIYEAWALNKPVVFADWLIKDAIYSTYNNSFENYIYDNQIGYHAKDIKEMFDLIDVALKYGINKKSEVFINGIFSKGLRGRSGKITASILMDLARIDYFE